jgi:hypothetical protein
MICARTQRFDYGIATLYDRPFNVVRLHRATYNVLNGSPASESLNPDHATPAGLTHDRFGLFRFRSPLLTESRLLSLPVGTEMFHFPTFPLPALYIQAGVTRSCHQA